KPDPESTLGTIDRAFRLGKHVKNTWQQVAGKADAAVPDTDQYFVVVLVDRYPDITTIVHVLGGVVQYVGQDLRKSGVVAIDKEGFGLKRGMQAMPSVGNQGTDGFHRIGHQL